LGFDPKSVVYEGSCTDAEWGKVLQASSFSTVDDIYDGLLQEHRWVEPGANTRSIGTLSQACVTAVRLPEWSRKQGCWMQVTGIYAFPDYLEGKSFADF